MCNHRPAWKRHRTLTASQHLYEIKYNNHLSLPQRYDDKTRNESKYCTTKQQLNTYSHKHGGGEQETVDKKAELRIDRYSSVSRTSDS